MFIVRGYFIARAGTSEEKRRSIEKIGERQAIAEKGDLPPLWLGVEGCTTNNTQLITFKKGAFVALRSV